MQTTTMWKHVNYDPAQPVSPNSPGKTRVRRQHLLASQQLTSVGSCCCCGPVTGRVDTYVPDGLCPGTPLLRVHQRTCLWPAPMRSIFLLLFCLLTSPYLGSVLCLGPYRSPISGSSTCAALLGLPIASSYELTVCLCLLDVSSHPFLLWAPATRQSLQPHELQLWLQPALQVLHDSLPPSMPLQDAELVLTNTARPWPASWSRPTTGFVRPSPTVTPCPPAGRPWHCAWSSPNVRHDLCHLPALSSPMLTAIAMSASRWPSRTAATLPG